MSEARIGQRPRLLYIDDDEGLCHLITRAMTRRGYEVMTALSGGTGVELASAQAFDVIAVDHYMPGLDGLETLQQLQVLPNPPPVVYCTGSEESRIAVAALKAGADDYVIKGGSEDFIDLLASAVAQSVEQVRLRRERDQATLALGAANARLEAIVEHQAALLREVNHRVANSLQLVLSLVHMQSMAMKDPAARAALQDTQSRIGAIMQVHRRLYTSDDVSAVDLADYLQGLVEELCQSLAGEWGRVRIGLNACSVRVATDKAISLGIIVAELVTNACKYAYDPATGGEVRVGVVLSASGEVVVTVEDDGVGMATAPAPDSGAKAKSTGLGQKVIAAMVRSLDASMTFDPGHRGVRAVLTFPV